MVKNMKTLYESLLDDFDAIETNSDPISEIKKFIEDNYEYNNELKISKKPNKNGYYEVSTNGDVFADYEIQSLTNGMFIWKQVKGVFSCEECNDLSSLEGAPLKVEVFKCAYCYGLTSLKGAPKITSFGFDCHACDNIKTLEGAPEEVGGGFDCSSCEKLTSLKGAPKKVDGFFNCEWCPSLTSLEGAPEKVNNDFRCSGCAKLKSLKGAPKKIGRTVYCNGCGKQFTMADIEKHIDDIYIKDIIDL
jgi:hypothetical protein